MQGDCQVKLYDMSMQWEMSIAEIAKKGNTAIEIVFPILLE